MFIHHRTQGLILKKENQGEDSQLFTIYTKDYGKLKISGKAIRKIKSKLRPGADIFYLSNIEFIQGKAYKTLTDAILIEKFSQVRKKLGKLLVANKITSSIDDLTKIGDRDKKIWGLLLKTLGILNSQQLLIKQLQLIYYYFFWKIISFLGYRPELYNCASCQKNLTPGLLFFNPQEGGAVCSICFGRIKIGREISSKTIKILRFIIAKDWPTVSCLRIETEDLNPIKRISNYYLSFISKETIPDF